MHEVLYAAAPAAAGAWYGTRAWLARRRASRAGPRVAPPFRLMGTDGKMHALDDLHQPMVVLVFMSNRCPGVKAYDRRLRRLMADFPDAAFVGVNPIADGLHPGEDLASMRRALAVRRLPLALYLKDGAQEVARAYHAICTPEVVVLDRKRRIRYRGRIDDALVERDATTPYLRAALAAVRRNRAPAVARTAPLGCSIDSAAGNAVVAAAHPVPG